MLQTLNVKAKLLFLVWSISPLINPLWALMESLGLFVPPPPHYNFFSTEATKLAAGWLTQQKLLSLVP